MSFQKIKWTKFKRGQGLEHGCKNLKILKTRKKHGKIQENCKTYYLWLWNLNCRYKNAIEDRKSFNIKIYMFNKQKPSLQAIRAETMVDGLPRANSFGMLLTHHELGILSPALEPWCRNPGTFGNPESGALSAGHWGREPWGVPLWRPWWRNPGYGSGGGTPGAGSWKPFPGKRLPWAES